MITRHYTFKNLPFDHDVCHLFEHAVLRTFLFKLREKGYSRALFGWLDGQTIDSTLHFDIGTYSDEIAALFDSYITNVQPFGTAIIQQARSHIEAEMRCSITIVDADVLAQQFEQIAMLLSGQANTSTRPTSRRSLKVSDAQDAFEEVAVIVNVFDTSVNYQKAFLALFPVLLDFIRDGALDNESAYPTGRSAIALNDDGIGIAWRFTIKKTAVLSDIQQETQHFLHSLPVNNYTAQLKHYRKFITERDAGNTNKFTNYYEQTGIKTDGKELANYITAARLEVLIRKLTVRILPVRGKLHKLDWDY